VWKEWEAKSKPAPLQDKKWFEHGSYDLGFQLNVDAFQPFEKVPYSMTAVFVALLNLPMEIRYQQENLILVALLPGFFKTCTYM